MVNSASHLDALLINILSIATVKCYIPMKTLIVSIQVRKNHLMNGYYIKYHMKMCHRKATKPHPPHTCSHMYDVVRKRINKSVKLAMSRG